MAKSSGDPKTPVIVALAFFVLATIVLGVLTYLAYDEKAKQADTVVEEQKKAADAQNLAELAQDKLLVYKVALGVNSADEFESLQNARNKEQAHASYLALKGEIDQALTKGTANSKGLIVQKTEEMIAQRKALGIDPNAGVMDIAVRADNLLAWNWPQPDAMQKPQRSLLGTTVETFGNQQLAVAKMNTLEEQYAVARKNYDDATKTAEAQKNASLKAMEDSNRLLAEKQKQLDQAYANRIKQFNDQAQEFILAVNKLTEMANDKSIKAKELQDNLTGLRETFGKLEAEVDARTDPFSFDNPHGKVTNVSGNTVTIDIGSAANVHTGLTFSVQPADTPTVGLQSRKRLTRNANGQETMEIVPKGTIEVTRVLGPNLSQARITNENDTIRDRILKGDVIYNAAWRPGAAENIALFGVFDVDADGIDDIKRVVRELENMGVNVNAYYDLEQKKWVGKLTERTYYIVEGYYPSSSGSGDEGVRNAKAQLTAALLKARTEAREKGGKIVKIRDFFTRIGYDIEADISEAKINQAYLPYLRTAPTADNNNGFGN